MRNVSRNQISPDCALDDKTSKEGDRILGENMCSEYWWGMVLNNNDNNNNNKNNNYYYWAIYLAKSNLDFSIIICKPGNDETR